MERPYDISRDPLFYLTLALFAALSVGLPGLLALPWMLSWLPAALLTAFLAMALRRGQPRDGLKLLAVWLVAQLTVTLLVTWLVPDRMEGALRDGFLYRRAMLAWFYTGQDLPGGLLAAPLERMAQLAGLVVGGLVSGGLVGCWLWVQAITRTGFAVGSLLAEGTGSAGLWTGLPPWTLLQLAGMAGLLVLTALPLWSGRRALGPLWRENRRLALGSVLLLLLGYGAELLLTAHWPTLFHS